ncbi:MAG TPA: NUDIX hydrolase [Longimicrobiaceae bacterium]|nr:NUDIX hydrolase [Longimicrobiaceae bacterium]
MVRVQDRRRRSSRRRQIWRYLRTAVRLLLRHPIPSVSVVPLLPDGRIVLLRRVDDDRWSLPGGMIDWGEDLETAARRELDEETGLRITEVRRLLGVYSSPRRDPRVHAINVAVVAGVEGEPSVHDPLEASEVHAFTSEELPFGYLSHDHEQQLRDFLAGRTVLA